MEDWNMLAADCVVISCCCQCLILQIIIFALLKLPCKLIEKTRDYAKRIKLQRRRRRGEAVMQKSAEMVGIHEEYSLRLEAAERECMEDGGGGNCGGCFEEVEKVMEDFYQKGEFAFGSFWGREGPWPWGTVPSAASVTEDDQNDDGDFVRYQIIEMVGSSFGYS